MRVASTARNRGLKGVAARLTFPNVPDPVFVNVLRTVRDNQLSAALGAFDHCSIALHGQSAFTSYLFRNAASAIVGLQDLKCACLDCYVLNRMSAALRRVKRKTLPLRVSEGIGLRSDQILFRFLSR